MNKPTVLSCLFACFLLLAPLAVVAADPVWIDVRTAEEFSGAHVSEAINIPYEEIADEILSVTNDKNAPIYVYCRSGRRSGIAKATLEEMGYSQVENVGGLDQALVRASQGSNP